MCRLSKSDNSESLCLCFFIYVTYSVKLYCMIICIKYLINNNAIFNILLWSNSGSWSNDLLSSPSPCKRKEQKNGLILKIRQITKPNTRLITLFHQWAKYCAFGLHTKFQWTPRCGPVVIYTRNIIRKTKYIQELWLDFKQSKVMKS